jgi:hypothetical protein
MILPHFGHTVFSEVRPFSRFTFLREGTRRFFERWAKNAKRREGFRPPPTGVSDTPLANFAIDRRNDWRAPGVPHGARASCYGSQGTATRG